MDTIASYLSSYTTSLTFADLPSDVVHQAKRMLVDTLGCAIGGYASEPSKIARAIAETVSSRRPATILGSGQQTSVDLATFANGVMIRYLDFNDGYTSTESGHPSDAIAAVLSPAEVAHGDGKSVITAIVLAYEVFCRICDAASVRRRGFDDVTVGVIASTPRQQKPWDCLQRKRIRRSISALRPTMRCIRRVSAMSHCGKAAPSPMPAVTPFSPCNWRLKG